MNILKRFTVGATLCVAILVLTALMTQNFTSLAFSNKDDKTENAKESELNSGEIGTVKAVNTGRFDKNNSRKTTTQNNLLVGTDLGLESEPNDTTATADPLTAVEGKIRASAYNVTAATAPTNVGTDADFFSFTTTVANSRIYAATINQSAASQDTVLAVIASDGTTVLESDDQDGSLGGNSSSIAGTLLATPGTYYLRVTNFSVTAPITPYDLYFAVRSGTPTAETEPNDNGTPQVIPASQYVSGTILTAAENDTFTFNANAGDTVFLSVDLDPERDVTTFTGRIGIGLFGTPANFLVVNDAGTGDTIDSEAITLTISTTGTYQVFIDANATGGSATATYNFNLTTIPAVPGGTCTTYTNNTPTAIADLALTTSTISIPDSRIIRSLRVTTNITHANLPDLDVHLRSPSSNDNGLFTDIGAAAQTGPQVNILNDEAAIPVIFTVNNGLIYKPEAAYRLNWFNGENSLGTWALDIRDDLTANAGTLNSWSLQVCEEAAPAGNLIYNQNFEANNGGYTTNGTANEWEYGTPATVATTTANPVAPFLNCASGTNCWKTDLDGTYDVSSNQNLVSPNLSLLPFTGTFRLYWQQRYQMESTSFDRIYVRVTNVNNPADTRIVWASDNATMTDSVGNPAVLIGASAGWGRYNADISDFVGKVIQVTYHLESDTTVNFGGFAVDDVQIYNVGPVAANAGIGGRVTEANGNAISRARVTITGSNGGTRSATTNSFGFYRFEDIEVGQTYVLEASRKGYAFSPRVITLQEDVTDADITAIE